MSLTIPEVKRKAAADIRRELKEPPMFKVLLLNDDYTTMEFVVEILMVVFHKSPEESTRIMLKVHREGAGIAGIYTRDVAETKVDTVHALAAERGYPLKCTLERT
jgi:ATP-dependent Clp protease adaptor protein ClpS